MQLPLAGFKRRVDAQALDLQAPVPIAVFVVELEIGGETGRHFARRILVLPGGPVNAPPQQGGHFLLEGGEDGLFVREIEVERPLGEARRLDDLADRGGVVPVALEDPAGGVQQLAAPDPLPLGSGEGRRAPRYD